MQYRHRLRSRIIISFLLLGTGLTAAFAVATIYLRDRLESQLIGDALAKNLDGYANSFYVNPTLPGVPFEKIGGITYSKRRFANVPFEWRDLANGVHDMPGTVQGPRRGSGPYKLAVRKDDEYWFFLWYDITQETLSQRNLMIALVFAVVAFSGLAFLLGVWSSARVMRPVSDLASRLRAFAGGQAQPEALAPHFADDEVGELAQALDDYADRLTSLVRRDREFNADVSHELRTPLAVIRGATELMLGQPDLNDKTRLRLQRIERAAQQCADLTSALLMLSRNERGSGATDVLKVASQVAEANRANLGGKPVAIEVEGEEGVLVDAPDSVLAVAMGNLVGNACKYTAEGEVRVRVLKDRVQIDDTGPGISQEDAERLFERGYRGSSAGASKGAGIGLAIVQRLCELYGWRVWLEPRDEGGARATLAFSSRTR
ncbi:MAG: HAMP domain-containing sensor histidine kinase [Lysobacteraceae bacterium]